MHYKYVIVGGGPAGASAIEGIRSRDPGGTILMVARENFPPYQRPPLSKELWFGKITKEKLPLHDAGFYAEHKVELALRREVVELDADAHTVWDDRGQAIEYDRLLLATGGKPRVLRVPGAEAGGVRYFRSLEDYLAIERRLTRLQHVLAVGGGFIGTELAAALRHAGCEVTFVYPQEYPLYGLLPRDLGLFVAEVYRERGIETISNERVIGFEDQGELVVARTGLGNTITTQIALVGAGIEPHVELAEAAGLAVGDGIEVDEFACTSHPQVFAAGDVAEFPYLALGRRVRIEHWDHALEHGRAAGANMAGAEQAYDHMPLLFSDFFDLGWEAVGEISTELQVEAVWKEPLREGVIFYLADGVVRGALMWNVWEKVDWARRLIREGRVLSDAEREQAIAG